MQFCECLCLSLYLIYPSPTLSRPLSLRPSLSVCLFLSVSLSRVTCASLSVSVSVFFCLSVHLRSCLAQSLFFCCLPLLMAAEGDRVRVTSVTTPLSRGTSAVALSFIQLPAVAGSGGPALSRRWRVLVK